MVLYRSLAMLFFRALHLNLCLPCIPCFSFGYKSSISDRLAGKNIVKIIFRSRKTNPQYSCFLPFFMHFSLLVHAYFVVFCLKHIGLRCKNQPFALQKTAFCIVKCALL